MKLPPPEKALEHGSNRKKFWETFHYDRRKTMKVTLVLSFVGRNGAWLGFKVMPSYQVVTISLVLLPHLAD